jgi:hypothetical protein
MHGTSIDSNFNTVKHYEFGHNCPELQRQYNRDIDRIHESNMKPEQKRNAIDLAGYQNMWGY